MNTRYVIILSDLKKVLYKKMEQTNLSSLIKCQNCGNKYMNSQKIGAKLTLNDKFDMSQ